MQYFEDYLKSKKINPAIFQKHQADLFESWKIEFQQMSDESFTERKKYLINNLRRQYPILENKH